MSLPAAQIEYPRRPRGAQRAKDRRTAPRGERNGPLRGLFAVHGSLGDGVMGPGVLGYGVIGLGVIGLRVIGTGALRFREAQEFQAPQRVLGEPLVPGQVTGGDQGVLGVLGQPSVPRAEQLVDLVRGDPVVLGVVEDGEQHVQPAQGVGEADLTLQHEPHVPAVAPLREPLVERYRGDGDLLPAEQSEEPVHELGAAPGGERRYLDAQRPRPPGEFGPGGAVSCQRAAEHCAERDGEEGGRRVGAVVDVLRERGVRRPSPALAPPLPHERERVHLQQQRGRAPFGRSLGVEDVGGAVGSAERLRPRGVLVQQEAQVGSRFFGRAGGGDRQEHAVQHDCRFGPGPTDFAAEPRAPPGDLPGPERIARTALRGSGCGDCRTAGR